MDSLTFYSLVTQLIRHEQTFKDMGFQIEYLPKENIFMDLLMISWQYGCHRCFFVTEHRSWDQLREFCLYTNNSDKYYYRLNPVNGCPIRVNQSSLWFPSTMTLELEQFGDQIIRIINELQDKIKYDIFSIISK